MSERNNNNFIKKKKTYIERIADKRKLLKRVSFFHLILFILSFSIPVYATDNPLTVIDNLSNFIFGLIRGVGMIILGFSIVQIGLSFKSHDPSQRANGFLTLAGGVVITFAREILNIIIG